jgi:hypothetical protein
LAQQPVDARFHAALAWRFDGNAGECSAGAKIRAKAKISDGVGHAEDRVECAVCCK